MHSDEALGRLMIGNRRYAASRQVQPRQTALDRQRLVRGQYPFAAVLSCSDSRVPSEIIFDQGLGDLFVVRTAGHASDETVLASLEYAVLALEVSLIMVLGHTQCGAVAAVMRGQALPGHLPQLATRLRPAFERIDPAAEDAADQAVRANSRLTAERVVCQSDILAVALKEGRIRVVSAYYDLTTGRVELLD